MSKLLHAIAIGVLGAGIVHIAILFLLPAYSGRDAWSRLAAAGDPYSFVRFGGGGDPPIIKSIDPMFDAAACRFDLADGVVHVHADGHVPFWSISVYDRKGQNIYSLNDRTASGGKLDLVVVAPVQMIEVRKDSPDEFKKSVFVEADVGQGIIVVRAFAPDDTWKPLVSDYLDSAACELR